MWGGWGASAVLSTMSGSPLKMPDLSKPEVVVLGMWSNAHGITHHGG
ncbi:MAG: hypothetical protein F6K65_33215 [Moorea sp. SIO3C2]|nr:hypothetical protein [Moorena sp. SIO3C2]